MPLAPGFGPKLSLGLCNSVAGTLAVEFLLYAAGVWFYLKSTVARDRVGFVGTWAPVLFLTIVELANIFGPPPPSVSAVAWSAEAMWLHVASGYWIDRHREPIGRTLTATRDASCTS